MKIYLYSLGAGVLVGLIYALLNVRSPAPPMIALIGLLGILIGEQSVPVIKRMLEGHSLSAAWYSSACDKHIFGALPGRGVGGQASHTNSQKDVA